MAPTTAKRAAAMDRCRDSSTTEGIQIQPVALAIVNRLKEEIILEWNQKSRVRAAPDITAAET
jgi:hypothetical protein